MRAVIDGGDVSGPVSNDDVDPVVASAPKLDVGKPLAPDNVDAVVRPSLSGGACSGGVVDGRNR